MGFSKTQSYRTDTLWHGNAILLRQENSSREWLTKDNDVQNLSLTKTDLGGQEQVKRHRNGAGEMAQHGGELTTRSEH